MKSLIIIVMIALSLLGCHGTDVSSDSYWLKQPGDRSKTVIIFIHGVLGDSHETWATGTGKPEWPDIVFNDKQLQPVDVYAVGYKSGPLARTSNIEEIAVSMLRSIEDEQIFKRYDNVVFVVHSMGGLITKRMLRMLQVNTPESFHKVKSVIFFSTPAQGADLAAMAKWISNNPQFENMKPSDFNPFLQVLDNDWNSLLRARTVDAPFPKSYCAYETEALWPVIVVPRSGSERGCDETPVAFARNHSTIVKPLSADDEIHKYLRARILESLSTDDKIPQRVVIKLVKPDGSLIKAGDNVRSGDQYAIEIHTRKPAWFYVFNIDSTGYRERYFPNGDVAGLQYEPVTSLRVPGDPQKFMTLDNNTGIERLYFFVLENADQQLEKEHHAVGITARVALDNAITTKTRGAYVSPQKISTSGETILSSKGDSATDILIFEHKP
ncbi:DUF4384 domain-containing protein [Buttiauxella sp. WJP83]|uniref:DUF4384 domain-containing protein n=1 Tax=Buttiauxella sp. WJP83 TaxID=2986951 RepID=UPI0022DCFEDF|nr:DUF4384 domain-containing protein [Buttiauxella sp. WJP83]WBM69342.1 DUF4384 domain-containing protein [Buttiauxella sp. WJP83]